MTYNQIIKLLRDFSDAHYQLKSFGNGEPWELVENSQAPDLEYPMMWAQDLPNTVIKGEEMFKFRMYFLGQVATVKEKTETTLGETNVNEVKSDMRQCALDLASFLVQDKTYPDIDSTRDLNLTSFVDDFNDKLTGWYFDLTISQSFSFSACAIPMDGIIPPPPSGDCLNATILINGINFTSVPSGDAEDLVVKDTDGTVVGSKVGNEWIVPKGSAVCLDATQIIKDSLNNILYSNNIPSGDTEEQVISDSTIANSNATFNDTIEAQGNKVLPDVINIDSDGSNVPTPAQVPFVSTLCPTLVDGVVTTKDSDNNTLYNTPVPNNGNIDQVINDSSITNSNASYNDTILAQGNKVLPDIIHTQTDGTLIALPAQTPLVCDSGADATQVIKDSDNVVLYTNNIASGTSQDQIISDSPIANSNATFNDTVKAQDTYIITDTTYEVYLDGVLQSTVNLPSQVNQTININWI